MSDYYSYDELLELGCPVELIDEYLYVSKKEIDAMLERADNGEDL